MGVTLKDEAFTVIRELNLIDLLNEHGEAELVGSVAFDLIVKPDIDIHLLTKDSELLRKVNEVYIILLEHKKISEVRISDYRPNGVKIGIDQYHGEFRSWDIDIWISDKPDSVAFEQTESILSKLTAENRKTIIEVKQHYYRLGQLRNGLSLKIYNAVFSYDVKNVVEFEKYLTTTNVEA